MKDGKREGQEGRKIKCASVGKELFLYKKLVPSDLGVSLFHLIYKHPYEKTDFITFDSRNCNLGTGL